MITLDPRQESGRPLYWQIYAQIRRDITSGALPARDKLPSKRGLAPWMRPMPSLPAKALLNPAPNGAFMYAPWAL